MDFTQIGSYRIYKLDDGFAVTGNTYAIKDNLLKMGGKFRRDIPIDGVATTGWVFSSTKSDEVEGFLKSLIPKPLSPQPKPKIIPVTPYNPANLVAIELEKIINASKKEVYPEVEIKREGGKIIIKGRQYQVENLLDEYKDYEILSYARVLDNAYVILKK